MKKQAAISHRQLLRLRKILALLRERERVTQAEMAWANECSTKSIQRDVGVLQGNGWPIEFDKRGYFLSPQFSGDLKSSRNEQVAALVLAGCAVDKHLVEHFPSMALAIRGSVLDLPDVDSLEFCVEEAKVCVEQCPMDSEQLEVFGAVARNILEGLAIEFNYRAVSQPEALRRVVYPIVLKQKEGVWYLVGFDLQRGALRIFTVSKIKDARTPSESYSEPSEEALEEAQKFGEFSIWDSGNEEAQTVKVKLFSYAADFVRSHRIHHSQKVEVIDEESVMLSIETSDIIGVNLWLRRFMNQVQILEPESLKAQFVEDLMSSCALNG